MPRIARETLTSSQAAKLLHVSVATVKRWASAGLLASERTAGGHRRYRESDLRLLAEPGTGDPTARRVDRLLGALTPLATQTAVLQMKLELGSWWGVADAMRPLAIELHRRHDAGTLSTAQWVEIFDRLERGVRRFLDHVPYAAKVPRALLSSVPNDRGLLAPALLELGLTETPWSANFAAGLTPQELAAELRRERVDAVVVSGSADADARLLARHAPALAAAVRDTCTPLLVLGVAPWPDPFPGATRCRSFEEVRQRLEDIASRRPPEQAGPPPQASPGGAQRGPRSQEGEAGNVALRPARTLGLSLIDEQHRLIIEYGERFIAGVRDGAPSVHLGEVLSFLRDSADVHFGIEENLMRAAEYPGLDGHLREHREFAARIAALVHELEKNGDSAALRDEAAEFVRSWLSGHVAGTDRRLATYLRGPTGDAP
ncbi:MAG TPA: hemerythrin domain-containing protein [Anaeromyxobacteraceae bacterium]|nr:hemerythrin domain-containing protein [Anaeromyxobacteraceae bacterium]